MKFIFSFLYLLISLSVLGQKRIEAKVIKINAATESSSINSIYLQDTKTYDIYMFYTLDDEAQNISHKKKLKLNKTYKIQILPHEEIFKTAKYNSDNTNAFFEDEYIDGHKVNKEFSSPNIIGLYYIKTKH